MSTSSSTGKYLSPSQRQQLLEILTEPNIPDIDRKRIQIILFADEGKSPGEIRKLLDCTAATASKWILIAESGKIDHWQKYRRGRPPKVDQPYLDRLKELITKSPRDFGYSFKRWSGVWLAQHLEKEFGVALTPTHINRLRKQLQPLRIVDLSPSAKA
jgi:transposase